MVSSIPRLRIHSGYSTDAGPGRERNDDAFVLRKVPLGFFAAVADGVGMRGDGESSAAIALASMLSVVDSAHADPIEAIRRGFETANANLRIASEQERTSMTANCVVAVVSSGRLYVAHVGNARLYLLRGANLYCLARNHSSMQVVGEANSKAGDGESASSVDRCASTMLGAGSDVGAVVRDPVILASGDTVMLCSDGLICVNEEKMIRRVLAGRTPREAAVRLVNLAAQYGCTDSATVLVLRVDAAAAESVPVMSLDELTTMRVRTADGHAHQIVDVVMNPTTWAVSGFVLDLSDVKPGAVCEIPVRDVGPLPDGGAFIVTPQRTDTLLAMYRSDRNAG